MNKITKGKSIGMILLAALMVCALLVSGAAADIVGSEARVAGRLELRSFAEGLSLDGIRAIATDIMAKATAKGLMQGRMDLFASAGETAGRYKVVPELQADEVIVAFGYVIGPDGVPSLYLGTVSCARAVTKIHQRAQEWYKRQMVRLRQLDPQASNPQWPTQISSSRDRARYPFGNVSHSWWLHRLVPDNDPDHDFYAIRQFTAVAPGYLLWDTNYQNDWLYIRQMWGGTSVHCTFADDLLEWDPLGTQSGSQMIIVSFSQKGATLGWTYTQPNVVTYDLTDDPQNRARWEMNFHTHAVRTTTGGMEPGSVVRANAPQVPARQVIQIRAVGGFQRQWWWGRGATQQVISMDSIWWQDGFGYW